MKADVAAAEARTDRDCVAETSRSIFAKSGAKLSMQMSGAAEALRLVSSTQPRSGKSARVPTISAATANAPLANAGNPVLTLAPLILLLIVLGLVSSGCSKKNIVVVYTSQDQEYAEPILRDFTRQTGIEARVVYDNEAVKTVGLANRLLAEKMHPQCDVFWNNEELRTRQLAAASVFRETNGWATIGYRSRRLVINTNQLPLVKAPHELAALTNLLWRGKVTLAYPMFGTTATHFLALRQHWGEERWQAWCRALSSNSSLLVDGNSVVVKMVGRGESWIGMTDSDDVAAGQRQGLPLAELPLDEESLLIPNTIGVVRHAPHPAQAQWLFDWLQKPEITARLIEAHALEGASRAAVKVRTLTVDWASLLRDLVSATTTLQNIFVR